MFHLILLLSVHLNVPMLADGDEDENRVILVTSASNIFSLLIRDHKSHHYSRHSPTSQNDPSCRFAEEMKSWEGLSWTIDKDRAKMMISSKSGFHFWILYNVRIVHWTINKEREREKTKARTRLAYQRRCRPTQQIFVQNFIDKAVFLQKRICQKCVGRISGRSN